VAIVRRELEMPFELAGIGIQRDNRIAEQILGPDWEEKLKAHLENYRHNQIYITITLMLAIASEVEGHFHFGRNQKARYLWKVFSEHSDITKDFWDTRYSALLPE